MKNKDLLSACEYAYKKGLELEYCTDMEATASELILYGERYQVAIMILFDRDALRAKLLIKKDGFLVYQKVISETKRGIGLFLEVFYRIVLVGNIIIIEGPKDVDGFPITIPIEEIELNP